MKIHIKFKLTEKQNVRKSETIFFPEEFIFREKFFQIIDMCYDI